MRRHRFQVTGSVALAIPAKASWSTGAVAAVYNTLPTESMSWDISACRLQLTGDGSRKYLMGMVRSKIEERK
ncbi:MAG: hypothetical protein DRP71_01985 [Verrucomicrobia bacterium]|nr:MAG: hypothetical protein DRP71_01985 [Verrucomicrobiota bacterium]